MEKSLRELEFAASMALVYGGKEYPKDQLDDIWKEVLLYQFHDILPGSSIKRVYDESLERYEQLYEKVQALTKEYYVALSKALHLEGTIVFNSLPWDRSEWLESSTGWKQITIPAMGYLAVDESAARTLPQQALLRAEKDLLENDLLLIRFNENGTIASIYDKENKRETIASGEAANQLTIYHDHGDAWDFPGDYRQMKSEAPKLVDVKCRVEGPYATIVHQFTFGNSVIQQSVVLTLSSRRIDFQTKVDWKESRKMLRSSFPFNVRADQVTSEIQFGYLKRPTHRNTLWDFAKDEICAHHWIDLSEPGYGAALLNDSKYGHRAQGNVLDINLLRSPQYPDPEADQAEHEFVYSLYPHHGDFNKAEVYKRGYELNVPVYQLPESIANSEVQPKSQSLIELSGDGVMIESIKKAEDEHALIIRLYEAAGSHSEASVKLAFATEEIYETNLLEKRLDSKSLHEEEPISFTPFEIKTIKYVFKH